MTNSALAATLEAHVIVPLEDVCVHEDSGALTALANAQEVLPTLAMAMESATRRQGNAHATAMPLQGTGKAMNACNANLLMNRPTALLPALLVPTVRFVLDAGCAARDGVVPASHLLKILLSTTAVPLASRRIAKRCALQIHSGVPTVPSTAQPLDQHREEMKCFALAEDFVVSMVDATASTGLAECPVSTPVPPPRSHRDGSEPAVAMASVLRAVVCAFRRMAAVAAARHAPS